MGTSLTNARIKAMIDTELGSHTHIGYSTNGTTETANIARTSIASLGGWTTPAAGATYAPANASAGDSAAATTAGGTVTHVATFSASTAGTQLSDWIPTTDPDAPFIVGGKVSHSAGAICVVSVTKP